jgi:hypothetical protein
MAGYEATQIRWPESDAEFEKRVGVLFRAVLNDPNVKRAGTKAQSQDGVDLVGHRDRNIRQLVGIQCKLKESGKKLSDKAVRDEVKKALKYKPLLKEYFIVTTAKDDLKLQQLAQTLTQLQLAKGRKIRIDIWGGGTLSERINEHESAKQAFDPGFSPAIQAQKVILEELVRVQGDANEKLQSISSQLDVSSSLFSEGAHLPRIYADRELTEELSRALRRRGFMEANITMEILDLANRALTGNLIGGSPSLRAEVIERAARTHATADTRELALRLHQAAKNLTSDLNFELFDALYADAQGKTDEALRLLRAQNTPDSLRHRRTDAHVPE